MTKREKAQAKTRRRQLEVLAFLREVGKANTREIIAHLKLPASAIGGIIGQLTKQREIIGVDTGKTTYNGNTIQDYYPVNAAGEAEETGQHQSDFALGDLYQLAAPSLPIRSVIRHNCSE